MASTAASFAAFVGEQVRKTRQRPLRLLTVPLNLARKGVRRSVAYIAHPIREWRANRERLAQALAGEAEQLLEQDRPEEAWSTFEQCLKFTVDPLNYARAALCLLQAAGQADRALHLFAECNAIRRRQAETLGVSACEHLLFDPFWQNGIGHLATIDYAIKLSILDGRRREHTIIYVPPHVQIPNRFLLEQWRPYARIIDYPNDLPFSEAAVDPLHFDYLAPTRRDGTTGYFWTLAAETYQRWQAEGRKPLLQLPEEEKARGWTELRRHGIPNRAWFVALHVREANSKPSQRSLMAALNANALAFLPAINEITRRGGWVIRMGDPNMAPLPPVPNVFDYCHSDARSDWMDIFIASQCRFFLGTSSGPAYVPSAYGVSCVLTNWWPPVHRPWHAGDIFIPKLCRHTGGRRLTLDEMLQEPVGWSFSSGYLATKHQVVVEDSTPDDIRTAAIEMLDRLDGGEQVVAGDEALHDRVDRIFETNSAFGMAKMSTGFLRKYQDDLLS